MVGVSRSPLSRSVRKPREIDRMTGVSYGTKPALSKPAQIDRMTGVDYGTVRPTSVSAPTSGFGGYTNADATRFMEAIRGDTSGTAGAAFGAGYDPLVVPQKTTPTQDALFSIWEEQQAFEQEQTRQAQEAANALAAQQAADAAAAAAAQAELDRLTGAYSGVITGLEGQLGDIGTTYADLLQGVTDLYGGQEQGVRDLFAGYGTQLGEMGTAATGRIDAATLQAMERLAAIDPEAAFQWNVQAGGVPQASSAGYLEAIGASPAEVEAARMLGQQLITQQLGQAEQYAAGSQAALDRERASRLAASGLLSQQAMNQLAAAQAAYGAQLSAGELARIQALQQAGLAASQELSQQQLMEEQTIRNAILQARLDAAAAGVTV